MMWYKKYWLWIGLLFLFLVVSLVKGGIDDFNEGIRTKPHGVDRSRSLEESRQRGILVAEFTATPATIQIGNASVTITEAWLEERVLDTHFLVWFPTVKHYGDYHLCFRVSEEGEKYSMILFMPKGQGHSFGNQGDTHYTIVKDRDLPSMQLDEAVSAGKPKVAVEVVLKRK